MALCRECGEWFVPEDVWDVYCSPECAKAEWLREVKARKLSLSHQKKSLSQTENSPTPPKNSPIPHEEPEPKTAIEASVMAEAGRSARQCVCAVCGREFTSSQPTARYCSMACKDTALRQRRGVTSLADQVRTCPECGTKFTPHNSQMKYCCKACHDKAKAERNKGDKRKCRAKKREQRAPVVKTCAFCGEQFETKHAAHTTCDKCRATAIKDSRGRLLVLRTCPECGTEFRTYHSETVCCSAKCTYAHNHKHTMRKTCEVCGREFTAACNNAKICSDECRRLWKRVYEARNRAKTNGKEMLTKTCCICKHTFVTTNKDKECCSTKCRCKLELEKKKGKLHTCPECGKIFGSNLSAAKYCSTKCRDAAEKKRKEAHHGHICAVCGKEFALEGRHSRKYCSEECAKKAQNAQCVQYQTQIRNELLPPPTRKCHDCGAPTDNYRCKKCLAKWRSKYAVSYEGGDVDERYSICC